GNCEAGSRIVDISGRDIVYAVAAARFHETELRPIFPAQAGRDVPALRVGFLITGTGREEWIVVSLTVVIREPHAAVILKAVVDGAACDEGQTFAELGPQGRLAREAVLAHRFVEAEDVVRAKGLVFQ